MRLALRKIKGPCLILLVWSVCLLLHLSLPNTLTDCSSSDLFSFKGVFTVCIWSRLEPIRLCGSVLVLVGAGVLRAQLQLQSSSNDCISWSEPSEVTTKKDAETTCNDSNRERQVKKQQWWLEMKRKVSGRGVGRERRVSSCASSVAQLGLSVVLCSGARLSCRHHGQTPLIRLASTLQAAEIQRKSAAEEE